MRILLQALPLCAALTGGLGTGPGQAQTTPIPVIQHFSLYFMDTQVCEGEEAAFDLLAVEPEQRLFAAINGLPVTAQEPGLNIISYGINRYGIRLELPYNQKLNNSNISGAIDIEGKLQFGPAVKLVYRPGNQPVYLTRFMIQKAGQDIEIRWDNPVSFPVYRYQLQLMDATEGVILATRNLSNTYYRFQLDDKRYGYSLQYSVSFPYCARNNEVVPHTVTKQVFSVCLQFIAAVQNCSASANISNQPQASCFAPCLDDCRTLNLNPAILSAALALTLFVVK